MPTTARPRRMSVVAIAMVSAALHAALPGSATAAAVGDDHPGFTALERHFGPSAGQESATAIALQPDGKVLVSILNDAEVDRRIIRLLPGGELDASWGTGGVWHLPRPNATYVRALALQPDGKVVFAGEDATRPGMVVGRLSTTGELDVTFAGDGLHVVDTPADSQPLVEEVLVEPNGKISFAGVIRVGALGDELFLGRLTSVGTDDADFHGPNIYRTFGSPYDGDQDSFGGIARMPNGEYIVGDGHSATQPMVYRIGANASFLIAANVPFPSNLDTPLDVVASDATHVAVLMSGEPDDAGVAFLDVSGTPKLSTHAGNSGSVQPFPATFRPHDLLLQPDGRWVVAGIDVSPAAHRAFARLNANGTVDPSFGAAGLRHLSGVSSRSFYLDRSAVVQRQDGSLVTAYHVAGATTRMTAVASLVGRIARVRAEVVPPPTAGVVERTTNFTVRVTNDGPDPAGPGSVSFSLSPGMRVMSVTGVSCTAHSGGGTCRYADLAPGATFDVTVRVRASRAGVGSIAAVTDALIWDDDTGNDTATGSLQFDAAPTAAANPPTANPKPTPRRLALTLHRITRYQGRVINGCGTMRRMCVVPRLVRGARVVHAYVRTTAKPVPASRRRTVLLVMQERVRGRWVTRHRPRLPVGASGVTDVRLPAQWRSKRGTWRLRTQTIVPRGRRVTVSRWLVFRVR